MISSSSTTTTTAAASDRTRTSTIAAAPTTAQTFVLHFDADHFFCQVEAKRQNVDLETTAVARPLCATVLPAVLQLFVT